MKHCEEPPGWALQSVFWWGLLLKHKELLGWLNGLHQAGGRGGGYLAQPKCSPDWVAHAPPDGDVRAVLRKAAA